jgi:hypothetical protein
MQQPFYLNKKCSRGWDYKITVLGLLASFYIACYLENAYSENENERDEKWKEENAICCCKIMML